MTPRVKQTASITIGEFFERHATALSLTGAKPQDRLVGGERQRRVAL